MTGNANIQTLALLLGTLSDDPLYLVLKFKSILRFMGTNTAEYLIATITSPKSTTSPGAAARRRVAVGNRAAWLRRLCQMAQAAPRVAIEIPSGRRASKDLF